MEDYYRLRMASGRQSPVHSLNDNDDQENYNQDHEDSIKYVSFFFVVDIIGSRDFVEMVCVTWTAEGNRLLFLMWKF
jgi:hypothetical protein